MKTIRIHNSNIHEISDDTPAAFISKVQAVRYIRTGIDLSFTLYPTSVEEIEKNRLIWQFVNGDFNALNTEYRYYFSIEFPDWLYLFLKYSTWDNVQRTIVAALTGLYVVEPDGREYFEENIEPGIMNQVKKMMETHFKEFQSFVFIQAEDLNMSDEINWDYWKKEQEFVTKFDYFFRDQSGNPILIPYVYPVYDGRFNRNTSIFTGKTFDIKCEASYFTESDWDSIINNGSTDDLQRAESEEESWKKWKRNFIHKYQLD